MLMRRIAAMVIGLAIAYFVLTNEILHIFILSLGNLGLVGVFIAGTFFTSLFTTVPAIATLSYLGTVFDPLIVAALGALGSTLGDYSIFRTEGRAIEDIGKEKQMRRLVRQIEKTRMFKILKPFMFLLGLLVIASPLPDELAFALWKNLKVTPIKFFAFTYIFNFLGIFVIASVGRVVL